MALRKTAGLVLRPAEVRTYTVTYVIPAKPRECYNDTQQVPQYETVVEQFTKDDGEVITLIIQKLIGFEEETVQICTPAKPRQVITQSYTVITPEGYYPEEDGSWQSGAASRSIGRITGDGSYVFTIGPDSTGIITGLTDNFDYIPTTYIPWAFYFDNGDYTVIERGKERLARQPFTNTTEFKITRTNIGGGVGEITYYVDDVLVYTSLHTTGDVTTLWADAAFYLTGDLIQTHEFEGTFVLTNDTTANFDLVDSESEVLFLAGSSALDNYAEFILQESNPTALIATTLEAVPNGAWFSLDDDGPLVDFFVESIHPIEFDLEDAEPELLLTESANYMDFLLKDSEPTIKMYDFSLTDEPFFLLDAVLPPFFSDITFARDGRYFDIDITLPEFFSDLQFNSSQDLILPNFFSDLTFEAQKKFDLDVVLPGFFSEISLISSGTFTFDVTLPQFFSDIQLTSAQDLILPSFISDFSFISGGTFTFDVALPEFFTDFDFRSSSVATFDVVLPTFFVENVGLLFDVVLPNFFNEIKFVLDNSTDLRYAYAMNIDNFGITLFTEFSFESMYRYKGRQYGLYEGVLYELIPEEEVANVYVRSHLSDYGSSMHKQIPWVYSDVEDAEKMVVGINYDDRIQYEFTYSLPYKGTSNRQIVRTQMFEGEQCNAMGIVYKDWYSKPFTLYSVEIPVREVGRKV